jgi:imidazolonepropionase
VTLDLLVTGASEVLTCDGPAAAPPGAQLGALPRGVVGIAGDRVVFLGAAPPPGSVGPGTRVLDAGGGFVGPGFVDCHTHLVFAGDRADEFEQRCQGRSYLEIAAAGGGLRRTVVATSAESEEALLALARPRLARLLAQGVTTAEVKSGYGDSVEAELRLLRVVRRLGTEQPVTLSPTVLALHGLPPGFAGRRQAWLEAVTEELLPAVQREGLATCCDAFVEASAFEAGEVAPVLAQARRLGLSVRLHVEQLTRGSGAELAAASGARSADHLEQLGPAGIAALAGAGTIAVLLPTSTLFARVQPYAPGRALRDAGVRVAVATNLNPGSSMSENVFLALGLACLENGLTPAEAYLGFTRVAGEVLGTPGIGRLRVGGPADLVIYRADSYRQLPYHLAVSDVAAVVKAGRALVG